MARSIRQAALGALVLCAVLGGSAGARARASSPLAAQGPTGRIALTRWTLALDPRARGLARGWQNGAFAGRPVQVPSVIDAHDIRGSAGTRNYEGSLAWYRTSFSAPAAGTYALEFVSAAYLPDTATLYLRFQSGELYCYFDVPPQQYRDFLASDSKGQYFSSHIRDHFRYEHLSGWHKTANAAT